jgi:co-chaperonin GroES (HSP10)
MNQPIELNDDFVLIDTDSAATKTASGLHISENVKSFQPTGKILAVGPDAVDLEIGQRVVFLRFAALSGQIDMTDKSQENWRIARRKHIIGRIPDGKGS